MLSRGGLASPPPADTHGRAPGGQLELTYWAELTRLLRGSQPLQERRADISPGTKEDTRQGLMQPPAEASRGAAGRAGL